MIICGLFSDFHPHPPAPCRRSMSVVRVYATYVTRIKRRLEHRTCAKATDF